MCVHVCVCRERTHSDAHRGAHRGPLQASGTAACQRPKLVGTLAVQSGPRSDSTSLAFFANYRSTSAPPPFVCIRLLLSHSYSFSCINISVRLCVCVLIRLATIVHLFSTEDACTPTHTDAFALQRSTSTVAHLGQVS